MNYFPFHIGDYAVHTRHLTLMEDLAYRRLIDLYYTREEPLPADPAQVARLVGMREQLAEVEAVLSEFFQQSTEGWRNARCDAEIASFRAMAEGGKRGAAKRWAKGGDSPPLATPSPPVSTPNANQEPVTNNQEPKKRVAAGSRLPADFSPDFGFAVEQGIANTLEEAAKFRDYWNAQPGQKGVKTDWPATWRNWCRNAKKPDASRASEGNYARQMREKYEQVAPMVAAKTPGAPKRLNPMDVLDGLTRITG